MSTKTDSEGLPTAQFVSPDYYPAMLDKEIGCSGWLLVTQDMITRFADLTGDDYFIHVDPEKAKETPYGTTLAHGFLTLSLLGHFARECLPMVEGAGISLNYGLDGVRFIAPVKCGDHIRGRFTVAQIDDSKPGRRMTTLRATVDIDGDTDRPALVANWHSLVVF